LEEGILAGYSAGSAIAGLLQMQDQLSSNDLVVVILHDHGSRYMGKIFNDDWMKERGFLEKKRTTAMDLIECHKYDQLVTVQSDDLISFAIEKMEQYDISQIPVTENSSIIGALDDVHLYAHLIKDPTLKLKEVKEILQAPFPFVDTNSPIEEITSKINKKNNAVLVKDHEGRIHIITRQDIIQGIK
jgi:cystathionine beta-synthase